jgi:hypothetical protein
MENMEWKLELEEFSFGGCMNNHEVIVVMSPEN